MCRMIIRIVAVFVIVVLFGSTLVYARSQYATGLMAGYRMGEAQGKLEAMVALQQWQYNHKCQTTLDAYVSLKMWRDGDGQYVFDCLVKQRGVISDRS